ncbi:hemagglutinin repeat-containing protein, partial [Ralstonia solanacearum]
VAVQAGRDVINETQTISNLQTIGPNGYSAGATGVGSVGSISATNNVSVLAGRDITLAGATVSAGNNAQLAAGRDLNLGTVTLGTTQDAASRGGQSYFHDQTTTVSGSTVSAGGNVVAVAGRDATLTSSAIQAGGDATVVAGRNVTVTAASDTHTHSEGSLGADAQYKKSSYDETVQGSAIQTGNSATLGAGQTQAVGRVLQASGITPATPEAGGTGNVTVLGSSVTTGNGAANLVATGDVTVGAVNEKHADYSWSDNKHSGLLSSEQTTKERSSQSSTAVGSSISADSVTASAGRDLTVQGSTVAATNDVNLQAGRNLTVTTAQNTSSSHSYEETTKSGFGATGSGISYGTRNQKDTINDNAVTQTGSMVGSTGGNVNLSAGNALKVTGSQVIAAKDIKGTGADVTIEAAQGSTHHDEAHEVKQSGFTLGVSGGAVGAAIGAAQKLESAGQSKDGRASALWGVAAARDAFDAGKALAGPGGATAGAAVTLSWGSSQSKQTQSDDATQHTGSTVTAGGKASFTATGVDANGNKTAGDLNIVGSDVNAKQVALKAAHDVNIVSATDTDESHSRNESSSVSVGVSYGFGQGQGGFGVSASASKSKGNSDGTGATQVNSHVNGSESVSIASGNDTNVQGGVVSGGKVMADVGGNLNLASRQDTSETHAKQDSMGGGFSISQGGGSASFSASRGRADGTYANVTEQSGIRAGDGGFDINVKGNTDLKGAVIASTATPDKNQLTTGTLTWSDVKNHSEYSADSFGVSMGGTFGGTNSKPTSGQESGKNTGGISPMIPQSESGSQSGVAQAAISAGSITITNKDAQKQDVSTLNRDTTNTNTTVGKNPDLNDLLGKQADMMAAAQAAGEAVAKTVGDIADKKQKEANDRLKAANEAYKQDPSDANQAAVAAAEGDVANWKEGGSYRAALHSAGGALIAGLGGGNALAGAVGAGLSSKLAPQLQDLGKTVADGVNTGNADLNEAIGNLAANIAAGGVGFAVGGGSGAATAANVDRFNRQLHPDEQKWIKDNAKRFAQQQGISEQDAEQRLAQQGFRQVQNGVGGVQDQAASNFLQQAHGMLAPDPSCSACGLSYMFQATAAQKANADMYSSFLPQDRQNWFYAQNGLTQPGKDSVAAANQRAQTINNVIGGATIAAPVAGALLVGAPVATATGGVFGLATIGGTVGGGMDAAGQYAQAGTIRPVQSIFATATGAVTGPIGAQVGFVNNILLGGVGGAVNTAFNNVYYGENNNVGYAAAVGGLAGGAGYFFGWALTQGLTQAARPIVFPTPLQPNVPAVLQGFRNPMPGLAGATGGSIVQGTASFVPGYENK